MRSVLLLLTLAAACQGCASRPEAPSASNWRRRELLGISLEAPYEFIPSGDQLENVEIVTSLKPKEVNQAIEIRIDAMRFPQRSTPMTLEEWAQTRCSKLEDASSYSLATTAVGGLEARRCSSTLMGGMHIESIVFIRDDVYWHVDVFCLSNSLAADARRAIDSIQLR